MLSSLPRLRIAVLSYGLPKRAHKRGGIERAAHTLADGLARRGHDVVVFSHDPKPADAAYTVAPLPWKSFVDTWLGRRVTMGYLGNVLALVPDYREFDAVIAHGDSLLVPLAGKPVRARDARQRARRGALRHVVRPLPAAARRLSCRNSLTAIVSARRRRRQREHAPRQPVRAPGDSARRRRSASSAPPATRAPSRRCSSSARSTAASAAASCSTASSTASARRIPTATLDFVGPAGPPHARRHLPHRRQRRRCWRRCTGARGSTPRPAPTKASACRISRRWPVARRSSPRRIRAAARCSTTATTGCWRRMPTSAAELAALLGDAPRRASLADAGTCRAPRVLALAHARRVRGAALRADRGTCQVNRSRLRRSRPARWRGRRPSRGRRITTAGAGWRSSSPSSCSGARRCSSPARRRTARRCARCRIVASAAALVYYFRAPTGRAAARQREVADGVVRPAGAEPAARDDALDGRRGADRLSDQHRRPHLLDGARRAQRPPRRSAWCGCSSSRASSARRSASCRCTIPNTFLPPEFSSLGRETESRDHQLAHLRRRGWPRDHPSAGAQRHAGWRRRVRP